MPPKGGTYSYSRSAVREAVPEAPGVYWLWSFGELVRIGQSTDLRRRLLEYSDRNPNKFRYQTVDQYFRRRDEISRPPSYTLTGGTVLDKIEQTELEWYKRRAENGRGNLPQWNRYDKHYEVGVFERILSRVR